MASPGENRELSESHSQGLRRLSSRERKAWIAVAFALLASLVVAVTLFAGAGGTPGEDLETADGVLTEVREDRLRIRLYEPINGNDELELVVRPEDRLQLNLPHLREHVRDRVPTRVYFERDGEKHVARQAIDLPGLPQ